MTGLEGGGKGIIITGGAERKPEHVNDRGRCTGAPPFLPNTTEGRTGLALLFESATGLISLDLGKDTMRTPDSVFKHHGPISHSNENKRNK